jgi:hypothetical protein
MKDKGNVAFRETPYGTANGVSRPYHTRFDVPYRFGLQNRRRGGVSCNIAAMKSSNYCILNHLKHRRLVEL